ncbi:MAG: reverse transcriptase domain-containing protein, partial [Lactobacillaceae bacterium]
MVESKENDKIRYIHEQIQNHNKPIYETKKYFPKNSTLNTQSFSKWCKHHKTTSHQTKDCVLNKTKLNRKESEGNYKEKFTKSMIINVSQTNNSLGIMVDTMIENEKFKALIDTGSDENYLSEKIADKLNLKQIETRPLNIVFGSGYRKSVNKKIEVELKINNEKYYIEMYVLKELPVDVILGANFLLANSCQIDYEKRIITIGNNNVVPIINNKKSLDEIMDDRLCERLSLMMNEEEEENLNKILKYYLERNNKFSCIKKPSVKFLVGKNIPEMRQTTYSVPVKYVERGKEEIRRLLNERIIEHSDSLHASPAFFIKKKNNDLRLVINYQLINKYIQDDPWLLPKIDECLMDMGKNKYFSQLDLQNGFNQIKISKEFRKYTAFMLFGQQYQYRRLPFGLKPGPKIFQRHVSEILRDIENCFVYIDDIVIFTKTKEDHLRILEKVLKRLLRFEVKINFDKSKICVKQIHVLGYTVNEEGIHPIVTDKTREMLGRKIKTKRDVQRLVGLLNWYRKFIPSLSEKICNVTNLLQGKEPYKKIIITKQMKDTIENLAKMISSKIKLDFPDYTKKFRLECDASDKGIGCVLMQENKIIGYYSKKLHGAELNYTIVEKEYLSILLGLIHFKRIVQGNYVEVYTDNKNCTFDSKKTTSRISRWKLLLNEFNYSILHLTGSENTVADKLSRCFVINENEKNDKLTKLIMETKMKNRNGDTLCDEKKRIVINPEMYDKFIKGVHILSGHRGMSTTYYIIKDFYHIRSIRKNIKKIIETCKTCLRIKCSSYRTVDRDNKILAAKRLERVSTDIYGPFGLENIKPYRTGERGYILSITDIYSRFTRLYFFKRVKTKEIIISFQKWISEFKSPKFVISDNGKQFKNHKTKKFFQIYDVQQLFIPEYTPGSNGISERINKSITEMLMINKGKSMSEIIKEAEDCLNMNYNRSIGTSPNHLLTGQNFYDVQKCGRMPEISNQTVKRNTRFKIEDVVFKRKFNSRKLDPKYELRTKRI